MKRQDNSKNSSKIDSRVYIVDFKQKKVEAVFINETDKTVLNYLNKINLMPIKIVPKVVVSIHGYENILRFTKKAA